MLDDVCLSTNASDDSFVTLLHTTFSPGGERANAAFETPLFDADASFTILHFARRIAAYTWATLRLHLGGAMHYEHVKSPAPHWGTASLKLGILCRAEVSLSKASAHP